MGRNLFLYLGALFLGAFGVKWFTKKIRIPEVTGYVILGVILGGSVLRLLSEDVLNDLSNLSSVALGIIAFLIGIEFKIPAIRKLGRPIIFIVILESVGTFILVFLLMDLLFPGSFRTALLLGAVASATAPAATVAVIRQYRAKGPLTSTILAVVGMDDAVALIIYVVAASFVKADMAGKAMRIWRTFADAGLSILFSVILGIASAVLYSLLLRKVKINDWITVLLFAAITGMLGVCALLGISELLSIMTFGAVLVNSSPVLSKKSEQIMEGFSPVFLACFFILGGARLDTGGLLSIGIPGLAYFGLRAAGKLAGGSLGAVIGRAPKTIRKYVGFSLLPQVGVALALVMAIQKDFAVPEFGAEGKAMAYKIINILLFTTILTELIGPLLTRMALRKAGETDET